jgi:hypothetical protein
MGLKHIVSSRRTWGRQIPIQQGLECRGRCHMEKDEFLSESLGRSRHGDFREAKTDVMLGESVCEVDLTGIGDAYDFRLPTDRLRACMKDA